MGTVARGRRPRELGEEGRIALCKKPQRGGGGDAKRGARAGVVGWWRSSRLVGGEREGERGQGRGEGTVPDSLRILGWCLLLGATDGVQSSHEPTNCMGLQRVDWAGERSERICGYWAKPLYKVLGRHAQLLEITHFRIRECVFFAKIRR